MHNIIMNTNNDDIFYDNRNIILNNNFININLKASRLEAFSDGVIAIIIMVLDIKAPDEYTLALLTQVLPSFITYCASFIYVGCYWVHHHHLFHAFNKVNGPVIWRNLNVIFWLSLIPVSTAWLADSHESLTPVIFYGLILIVTAIYFIFLHHSLYKENKENKTAFNNVFKKGFYPFYATLSP
ncbi:TMEM175 family protein [Photobacterium proteolyticum]|uniref:TMEM175 family protein n=1 Tax=Photobacterium proteolyticum TaxID=1903952 RepID=UPI0009F8A073|nr:TMEM175 family protein [Photobacterium proteolyticum]